MTNVNLQSLSAVLYNLQALLKKKWILGLFIIFTVTVILLTLFTSEKPKGKLAYPLPTVQSSPTAYKVISPSPNNVFTPEQWQKIEEQRQADEAVGQREVEIRTNFPWFIKLPMTGEKYFVYFEPNSKVFTGLLYPKAGDNLVQIKAEITKKLKDVYGVPVENYTFVWTIKAE